MKVFLQSWKISQWLSWNLYIMSSTFHWIVPIVFWALLSGDLIKNGNWLSWWTNVNVHAMDLVIILVEFYLNRVPIYFSQLPAILVPGLLFMGYSFFQHAVYKGYNTASYPNGWWVYSFLDVSKSGAPLYYIGLLIAFGIIFCAVIGMHRLRDRVRARKPVL
ncbi:hypothetical protein DFS34DRAFT_626333 [Phlyctochytrium arcticum]|nr:hypothetical protein DFS34DRAFT_626333 [Phlyctochytrium arcticum]